MTSTVVAAETPLRAQPAGIPAPFAAVAPGREKRPLGTLFGLQNFGVNQTRLAPGARSSLHHGHSRQDEFVYVLAGEATLVTDEGETPIAAGMCAGFRAGGVAHHLENRGNGDVVYLEFGDRSRGDEVHYPNDDLHGAMCEDGLWRYTHKDGRPY